MGLFNKATELEKVTKERDELQKQAQEVQAKIGQVNNALVMARTEYMIDNSATTKKKVDKFEKALADFQKELEGVNKKHQAVAEKLSKLNYEKNQAHLEEIADQDVKSYERARRATLLEKFRTDVLANKLNSRGAHNYGTNRPYGLMREAGFNHVEGLKFHNAPESKPLVDLWNTKREEVDKRVQADFEELLRMIEEYLGE